MIFVQGFMVNSVYILATALAINHQFQNALEVLEKSQSKDHYKFHNLKGMIIIIL